jgi:hypothetical protein
MGKGMVSQRHDNSASGTIYSNSDCFVAFAATSALAERTHNLPLAFCCITLLWRHGFIGLDLALPIDSICACLKA